MVKGERQGAGGGSSRRNTISFNIRDFSRLHKAFAQSVRYARGNTGWGSSCTRTGMSGGDTVPDVSAVCTPCGLCFPANTTQYRRKDSLTDDRKRSNVNRTSEARVQKSSFLQHLKQKRSYYRTRGEEKKEQPFHFKSNVYNVRVSLHRSTSTYFNSSTASRSHGIQLQEEVEARASKE